MSSELNHDRPATEEEGYEYEYEYVEVEVDEVSEGESLADGELAAGGEVEYEYVEYEEGTEPEEGVEYEYEYVDEETGEAVPSLDAMGSEAAPKMTSAPRVAPAATGIESITKPQQEVIYKEVTEKPREVPAWVTSLAVHLGILGVLALFTLEIPQRPQLPPVTSIVEELKPEDFKFDRTVVDQIGNDSEANVASPSQQAASALGQNTPEVMERQLTESFEISEEPPPVEIVEPAASDFVSSVDLTGATEHVGGTEGAMDRLAIEIGRTLEDNKTLVMWVFDASQSQRKDRETVAERFENVYKQIGLLEVDQKEKALKTVIASFSRGVEIHTDDPLDDAKAAADVVRNIKDETRYKEENVFTAVNVVLNKFSTYRRKAGRNLMMIVVTDERGDDYDRLEETIRDCRRLGVKVFVVGPSTIFGRPENYVMWTYEDGFTEELPVDGGPETLVPTRLKLPFWGSTDRRIERLSSGFGPYALTRLASETGGMYLINKETTGPTFDPVIMKNYLPDYRPIDQFTRELVQNSAKRALQQAAESTRADAVFGPRLTFPADNDNVLRRELTEAQRPAAVFDAKLQRLEAILRQGEKDRDKLDSPRWQASYDLALGRVIAMRVRSFGYNLTLANMKSTPLPFKKEGSNSWRLVASGEVTGSSEIRKMDREAKELLSRVIDQHPGTPWAMLAEKELSIPMGWDWMEYAADRSGMRGMGNNNPNQVQLADDEDPEDRPRMQTPQKQRERPKL